MRSAALAGIAAFLGYLLLTPRVSGMGDGPEFTIVLATGGLAHPTGYPLYTMIGFLFVQAVHALGAPWPLAANLWSGAGAATAVGLMYALARRLAGRDGPGSGGPEVRAVAAALPAALLAVNPVLLDVATAAEVNSWSLAWACAAGLLFANVLLRLEEAEAPPPARRAAFAWGLLVGAGLAHHLLSALVSIPLSLALLLALATRRALRPAHLAAALAGAVIPLTGYAFVAWRAYHPAPAQWPTVGPSFTGVMEHVLGARYRYFLGFFAPAGAQRVLLAHGVYPFLYPGVALLLAAGARAATVERRIAWWGLLLAVLVVMLFGFQYGVPDPAPYFLPAVALGLAGLAPLVFELGSIRVLPAAVRLAVGVFALAAVATAAGPWIGAAFRQRADVERFDRVVRALWKGVPDDTVIVFWPADQVVRLQEYQTLDGEKRAAFVSTPDFLLDDVPRERFRRRFGIDPLEGLTIPHLSPRSPSASRVRERFLNRVIGNINVRTRVPVILFDPVVPMVRRLPKP